MRLVRPRGAQPAVRDPEEVVRFPELATLSAAARPDDLESALAVGTGLARVGDEHSYFYYDFLRTQLHEKIRIELEEHMLKLNLTDHIPDRFTQPIEDAAKARGELTGAIRCLLAVLEQRDLDITQERRAAIESCKDRDQVLTWTVLAATAITAAEVFGED
ncbi:hypothetical protein OIE67_28330 [Nonomuraea fuscirosea]|uniref:hypothetical protein n=1 Tax=Nonomuraea fuscirosea TaxID=1291556 RepID=UPI002DD97426|nr:hypothetical protein [Nonomuraea fuscirosea]WSA47994.1 hypothetical protein OIE67_28330 [Nonomuraea fuscirosea]